MRGSQSLALGGDARFPSQAAAMDRIPFPAADADGGVEEAMRVVES